MSSTTSSSDPRQEPTSPLERLAEEFTRRVRAGDPVTIEEYERHHPELAAQIRSFFPTIERVERAVGEPEREVTAPPKRIGEYEIVKEIGRGGMGVVLLAVQTSLGRRVALKLLPPHASFDHRFLERFRREARAAGRLQHPHIVQVYGVGEDQGLHFYAMQYIEGIALDRVIRALRRAEDSGNGHSDTVQWAARTLMSRTRERGGPHPVAPDVYFRNTARIALHVAEGLAYAHGHGILHRDVKPANLLMDAKGAVWIADFGLCRNVEDADISGSRDMVGTLRYMAPEQIQGRADARTDVYGLGVTLYEMLALQPPFRDESRARLMHCILNTAPVRPGRLRPGLSRDLEAIVLKAMAKRPEERYGSADALADDLRAYLGDRPVAARLPSAWYLARLAVRRNKWISGTIAAAVVTLLVITSLYVAGLRRAREERTRQFYIASVAAVESALRVNDTDLARRKLEAAPESMRGWEWRHLESRLDESLRTIGRLPTPVFSVAASANGFIATGGRNSVTVWNASGEEAWSLDDLSVYLPSVDIDAAGEHLAIADSDGAVVLASLAVGPKSARSLAMPSNVHSVRFSPDGQTVAAGLGDGSIRFIDVASGTESAVLASNEGRVLALAYTPDGSRIVAGSAEGPVLVWDLTAREVRHLVGHEGKVRSVAVSPDGARIASGAEDDTVRVWELSSGALLRTLDAHSGQVDDVAFSRDGRRLATCSVDRTLRIWDAHTGELERTLRGPARGIRCLAFTGAAGRLVTGALDGTLREWDIRASGGQLTCSGHLGDLWSLGFDATGARIATGGRDTTVRLWNARTGVQEHALIGHRQGVTAVALSPDGTHLASGDRGGGLRMWSAEDGAFVAELAPEAVGIFDEARAVTALRFHPDGERLFAGRADGAIEVWSASEHRLQRSYEAPGSVRSLDLHANGERLALGLDDGSVALLDATELTPRHRIAAHAEVVNGVAFDPTSAQLASVSRDGSLVLSNSDTGRVQRRLVVEGAELALEVRSLEGVSFSPDGTRLATAARSSVIVLWDTTTGAEVARIHEHRGAVKAIGFGRDGRLATGGWSGKLRIWDSSFAHARDAAEGTGDVRASAPELYDLCRSSFLKSDLPAEEARHAFRLAAGLAHWAPQHEEYATARGAALYRCGRDAEALLDLEIALGMSDTTEVTPELALFLVLTNARLGREDAARAALARAVELGFDRLEEPALRQLWSEARAAVR